jgi:uncharacterized protein with HEPN domain
MEVNRRDSDILQKIIRYCEQISEYVERFGKSYENLLSDSAYRDATAMCILQIGELTKYLSADFKTTYTDVPWRQILNMRNIAAHKYGSFSAEYLWDTICSDIPELKGYCEHILSNGSAPRARS